MRRTLPPVLALLGALLFVLGLLAAFWIEPKVARAPIDQRSRTVSTGSGSYYDFSTGEQVTSDQIRSVINTESDQSVYEGEDPLSDDLGVYEQTSGLFDDATGYEILYSESRIAIDRETALPVDCCGADDIQGLTIKWPFDVQQRDYELWDGTLGAAITASFVGVEEIDGLEVYRFEATVPPTDRGPAVEGSDFPTVEYEAAKAYLVEPVTGRIISSEQDVRQSLIGEDGETLFDAADVSLVVSDETIAENVDLAKTQTSQLGLLSTLGWLGPLLGLVLLVAGIGLARRADETVSSEEAVSYA